MSEFEKTIAYYQESAERDWKTAHQLFDGKNYSYALFFCHLTLEKLLKSFVVEKTDAPAPFIHNLVKLAELAEISIEKEMADSLTEIAEFNIAARYDDEKLAFYKKATKEFAEKYFNITEKIYLWLKDNYLKK